MRTLLVDISDLSRLREWAALCRGLAAVGPIDQVRAARREFRDLENVMFTPGGRDEIPWTNAQFQLIIDPSGLPPTPEMLRVLDADGRIVPDLDG